MGPKWALVYETEIFNLNFIAEAFNDYTDKHSLMNGSKNK